MTTVGEEGPTTSKIDAPELALARVIDGRPMPNWEPTLRAEIDAHWMIRLLRKEGFQIVPLAAGDDPHWHRGPSMGCSICRFGGWPQTPPHPTFQEKSGG